MTLAIQDFFFIKLTKIKRWLISGLSAISNRQMPHRQTTRLWSNRGIAALLMKIKGVE